MLGTSYLLIMIVKLAHKNASSIGFSRLSLSFPCFDPTRKYKELQPCTPLKAEESPMNSKPAHTSLAAKSQRTELA